MPVGARSEAINCLHPNDGFKSVFCIVTPVRFSVRRAEITAKG